MEERVVEWIVRLHQHFPKHSQWLNYAPRVSTGASKMDENITYTYKEQSHEVVNVWMPAIHELTNGFTLCPALFEVYIVIGQKDQEKDFKDYANFCALPFRSPTQGEQSYILSPRYRRILTLIFRIWGNDYSASFTTWPQLKFIGNSSHLQLMEKQASAVLSNYKRNL